MPVVNAGDLDRDTTVGIADKVILVDGSNGTFKTATVGASSGDGLNAQLLAFRGIEDKSANFTLTEADNGKIFTISAVDLVATLPATVANLVFHFSIQTVSAVTGFSISPAAADNINGGTDNKDWINTAATDVVGDSVTIVGDGANGWITLFQSGTWAAEA